MCARIRGPKKRLVKAIIWKRDGDKCWLCQRTLSYAEATIDHVIPVSHPLGSNRQTNLKLACEPCNYRRGNAYPYPTQMSEQLQGMVG